MKLITVILFLGFNFLASSQEVTGKQIFNDTSIYFIYQTDSLNPVSMSAQELIFIEELFLKTVKEYNERQQRLADSLYKKKKRREYYAQRIDASNYLYRLTPAIIGGNQKIVYISGDCKDSFSIGNRRGIVPANWKQGFIDGNLVLDGGSCFIYLYINLSLKTHGPLGMNGEG